MDRSDRNDSVPVLSLGHKKLRISTCLSVLLLSPEESLPWLPLPLGPGPQSKHMGGRVAPVDLQTSE